MIPENLISLHKGEEQVRAMSLEAIAKSEDMSLHLSLIERAADLIHYFIHRDEHRDEDDLIIRLLGMRMFNCLNATLKLLLSGYYQSSALQQRDIVETFFLLDYFSTDKALIARWRLADDKVLRDEFSPVAVRKKLDERDEYTAKKRAELYKLFSTLAGHPNPRGFDMLRLPNGDHHCGPFFEESALKATLSELGKSAAQVGGNFSHFFSHDTKSALQTKLNFLEVQSAWFKRFFGKDPMDPAVLVGMREAIVNLPD